MPTHLQRAHARERPVVDVRLERRVPALPVRPLRAAPDAGPRPAGLVCALVARAVAHAVHPQAAVVERVAELARDGQPKGTHARVLRRAPRVARHREALRVRLRGLAFKAYILMDVERGAVRVCEEARPVVQPEETVVVHDIRAVALAYAARFAHEVVRLVVAANHITSDSVPPRTENRNQTH